MSKTTFYITGDDPVLTWGQGPTLDQLRCRVMSKRTGDKWARKMSDDILMERIKSQEQQITEEMPDNKNNNSAQHRLRNVCWVR